MKKNLLLCYLVFAVLPLWADIFRPDSSSWVIVELHDHDTISLDSAALYKFYQATDTVRNVLIACKSPRSIDTVFSSVDITSLNLKDFKLTINARCNVHLQGNAVFGGTSSVSFESCEVHLDVDTLPEIGCSNVKLNVDRGAIPIIRGGNCRIGENMTGRISIQSMHRPRKSYFFNGEIKNITYPSQFIQEGGKVLGQYYFVGGTRNDTVVIVNGGEVAAISKNGDQVVVINGGSVGILDMGGNGHRGNVHLNGGEFRTSLGAGSVKWSNPNKGEIAPVDTLFFDQHAIVGYGHGSLTFRNKDGILKLDDILSLTTITGSSPLILLYENRALGEKTQRVEPTAVYGDKTYNITMADSLLVWDILSIYESKKCTIHYQVADGIAPKDSTYQEGLIRYFTTIPTRTNYDFMGWYADSSYTIRVDSLDEWSRGDTTLWARWEFIPERLTYETLGIQVSNRKELRTRYSEQQHFSIPDAIPEQPFYTFHGWHADSLTGPIVAHTADSPLVDMNHHILYGDFTREIPSLSIMIAQGNCLVVRNPDGHSELKSADYTWLYQDTIVVNGVDSIISDTLSSHKMYIEVGNPIPTGRYTSIIHVDEEWPIYVTRYIPADVSSSSSPHNSNTQTLFYIGFYILEVDDKGCKYLMMP